MGRADRGRSFVWRAPWLVVMAFAMVLGACSSSTSSGTPGSSLASTDATAAPAASALLDRLTVDGSDAAFERRFSGDLDGGAEPAYVFVGLTGGEAVLYVCDGTSGAWFTGPVAADGAGTLRSTDGDATVTLAPASDGLRITFDGGVFGGRSATATRLEVGDAQLVRLEGAPSAGGVTAAVGGIIITPAGVRGAFSRSLADGTSNTLIVRERTSCATPIGDGTSRTVQLGETCPPPPTTVPNCAPGTSIVDGNSNTINVGEGCSPPTTCVAGAGADGNSHTDVGGTCTINPTPVTTCPAGAAPTTIADGTSRTLDVGEGCTPPTTCAGTTPTTIADGSSRTLDVGERCTPPTTCAGTTPTTIADGSSRTLDVGETPPSCGPTPGSSTTTSASTPTTAPSAAPPGLVVSKTGNGLLTIRIGGVTASPTSSTTPTTAPAAVCSAQAAATTDVVRSLTDTLKALRSQLELFRQQRDALAAQAKKVTGAERDALQKKIVQLERSMANVQKQIDNVVAQVDELHRLAPSCPGKG